MQVTFPIFYVGGDDWMGSAPDLPYLERQLEYNEIYRGKYHGWDARGMSFRLVWRNDRLGIDQTDSRLELATLLEAMRRNAKWRHIEEQFPDEVGPVELWAAIESKTPSPSAFLWRAIRKLFGGANRSRPQPRP